MEDLFRNGRHYSISMIWPDELRQPRPIPAVSVNWNVESKLHQAIHRLLTLPPYADTDSIDLAWENIRYVLACPSSDVDELSEQSGDSATDLFTQDESGVLLRKFKDLLAQVKQSTTPAQPARCLESWSSKQMTAFMHSIVVAASQLCFIPLYPPPLDTTNMDKDEFYFHHDTGVAQIRARRKWMSILCSKLERAERMSQYVSFCWGSWIPKMVQLCLETHWPGDEHKETREKMMKQARFTTAEAS